VTLPTFIHIGPGRTATTMLYEAFKEHPEICMSTIKETGFFTDRQYHRGMDWYQAFFGFCADALAIGEVCQDYIYVPDGPDRIAEALPSIRLITVVRNPFDRIRSIYAYWQRMGLIRPGASWEEALEQHPHIVTRACHVGCLKRYLERFPPERIRVAFYDDLVQDPVAFVQMLFEFIGVDASFVPAAVSKRVNPSVSPRFRWLNPVAFRLANRLRRWNIHTLLGWAKESPFVRSALFKSVQDPVPQVHASRQVHEMLVERFVPQIRELEHLTGRQLEAWYASEVTLRASE
jgi:hypothetical protein